MKISPATLSPIDELVSQDVTLVAVPESTSTIIESDPVITSVTSNSGDSGMQMTFEADSVNISGSYLDQFPMRLSYTESQVVRCVDGTPDRDPDGNLVFDPTLALVQHTVGSWGLVPPPPDDVDYREEDIWFLYEFTPPSNMSTRSISYTVHGTMTTQELIPQLPPAPPSMGPPVTGVPFSVVVCQDVMYNLNSNILQFNRYVKTNRPAGLPYRIPSLLGS